MPTPSSSTVPALPTYVVGVPLLCLAAACSPSAGDVPGSAHEPVVDELISLLEQRSDLEPLLAAAIESADLNDIRSLEDFYGYLDELITWIPTEREMVPRVIQFHFVVGQAPDDALNRDPEFSEWMSRLAAAWGEFLDTPASAAGIETFRSMPNYNVDDYVEGPSGWMTFNQFFAREIRPGKRPIADPRDDSVVVSPADAVFKGHWPIDDDSRITLKGVDWAVAQLMDGSPYQDAFRNGVYSHTFLYVDDYHRYHTPVAGKVLEVRNIHGRVFLDVIRNDEGELEVVDGDSFQFNQERGLVVLDSPVVGKVAVIPVGMSFISSVQLTPDVGAELRKGDPLGFFLFGGSDIVMLFEDKDIAFDAEVGTKYLQGRRIAQVR